jgi:hypothetical protein
MFRVKTTRRNVKRALSPLKPASDPLAPPTNTFVESTVPATQTIPTTIPALSTSLEKQDKELTDLFATEAAHFSLTKPWLRLDRGMRMQKLRTFADTYEGLCEEDRDNLYKYLIKANDSKLLNTKQQINYDNGAVQAIKGLKIIRTGDPAEPATFKIETHRATKRHTPD